MTLEPKVTGLSPMTGPPGTKITVRGENLGQSGEDIIQLTVNGADCLPYLEWKSPKKIIIRCTKTIGSGDIIITTKSGGVGTCDVQFNCHEQVVGRTEESAVWVDDMDTQTSEKEKLAVPGTNEEYSFDLYSTMFKPHLYLLKNYAHADLRELEQLRENLQNNLTMKKDSEKNSSKDSLALYKSNLPVIMECLQILEHLSKLITTSKDTSIDNIVKSIDENLMRTHEVFDPLLSQKGLVRSIESAMQVFKQNETLFNLPSAIESSISNKNYDTVIKEISGVFSRLETTNIESSLKEKIHRDVTAKVEKLRSTIEDQLYQSCRDTEGGRSVEDIKKLIIHLNKLETEANFDVWSALIEIQTTLIDTVTERSDHFLRLAIEEVKTGNRERENSARSLPFVVQFVQASLNIFHNTYYDILALGQSYFDPKDEFACRESDELRQNRSNEFEREMVVKPIDHLCLLLRLALVPDSAKLRDKSPWPLRETEKYVICLENVLQSVITCHNHLNKVNLPLSARPALEDFKNLVSELRVRSMRILFGDATRWNKEQLHQSEDWSIEVDDLFGGRTQLPLIFEKKVIETLHLANGAIFMTKLPEEQSILKNVVVQASMKELTQGLINSFTDTLDKALIESRDGESESDRILIAARDSNRSPAKSINRLLITLCNCQFTKEQVFPRLQEEFEKLQGLKMDRVFDVCREKYDDYMAKLRDKFCLSVIKCANLDKAPKEDLQINLMIVNSQIFLIAPQLVNILMTSIVNSMRRESPSVSYKL